MLLKHECHALDAFWSRDALPAQARRVRSSSAALLLALLLVVTGGGLGSPALADPTASVRLGPGWWPDPGASPRYEAPVPGDVVRPFQAPVTTIGAGHRGVDLAAAAHAAVRAAADGRVLFAGPVAGTTWVAIFHADGVVTSYGPINRLRVAVGERVSRAAPIGTLASGGHGTNGADGGLHWGARVDGVYVDPMELLHGGIPRPSLMGPGGWSGADHVVVPYEPWKGESFGGLATAPSPVADRPGFAVPPNPNHLVMVPGLASSSRTSVIDPEHLGYAAQSVTRFSYAGRHDGDAPADDPRRDQLEQTPADTWAGTEQAAERLAEQLRAQARREPGRAVDLIGHSMGGVVLLRYLVDHHDPYDRTLPPVGHVVTVAAPLDGSDLASIGRTVRGTPLLGEVIGRLQDRGWLGGAALPLDAPAIAELSVGSEMLWELAAGWEQALHEGTAGPLATGTRVLNVGGARDLVVSSARTRQPDTAMHAGVPADLGMGKGAEGIPAIPPGFGTANGATASVGGEQVVDHRVLPGGHHGVLETEAMREVVWQFLAHEDVVSSPGHLSRLVGGELADSARLGTEVYSAFGSLAKVFRDPRRAVPIGLP